MARRPTRARTAALLFMLVGTAAALAQPRDLAADDNPGRRDPVTILQKGTSSKAAHKDAVAAIPLNLLGGEARQKADDVLDKTTIFREMPSLSFEVDPQVYTYFASYPDVAVAVWRAMDISECEMWPAGPHIYEADAGDGSFGVVEVLMRGPEHYLLHCRGMFKCPVLIKPIEASALVHVQTQFYRDVDGKTYARQRGHICVSFPSLTIGAAARILSPVCNALIDTNFYEVSAFVHMMWLAMSRDPAWVERLATRLDGVDEVRRAHLVQVTSQVYTANHEREFAQSGFGHSQPAPQESHPGRSNDGAHPSQGMLLRTPSQLPRSAYGGQPTPVR